MNLPQVLETIESRLYGKDFQLLYDTHCPSHTCRHKAFDILS